VKHRLITIGRILKTGVQNFFRNATLAVAAIAVMVITLTIVLFSMIANVTFANTIQTLTDKIDISVYLKDGLTEKQTSTLLSDLNNIENVKGTTYLSKEDALEAYKKQNEGNIDLLLAISQTDNPLPATIQIKPRDPNKISEIQAYLDKPEVKALQAEETSYSGEKKTAVDKITASTRFIRQAGLIGVAVFATVSILIIFNTIRMAIFNRRDEINIMRLLGAETWYIRGPYVVESVLYGLISAIISVSLCNAIFGFGSVSLSTSTFGVFDLEFARKYLADNFFILLAAQLGLGILIGAASSIIATRRYLKFKTSK
jgi:cell division transport system permease protein